MSLRLDGITRHFGDHAVLSGVDLHVQNEKVALLGPNGSGKTTLLRIAAGTLRPTEGTRAAGSAAYVPQDAPIYPDLSAAEHLVFSCRLHGTAVDLTTLGDLADVPAGDLSRGQRQKLHLVMALQSGADVLLLDEPFTGLDAATSAWLESAIQAHDGAIVMSLHDADRAARLCDRSVTLS